MPELSRIGEFDCVEVGEWPREFNLTRKGLKGHVVRVPDQTLLWFLRLKQFERNMKDNVPDTLFVRVRARECAVPQLLDEGNEWRLGALAQQTATTELVRSVRNVWLFNPRWWGGHDELFVLISF